MPGLTIGYLEQEPKLNPDHTVRESVEEAMGAVYAAKARLEEVYAAYGAEDADFDALAAEQAELRSHHRRRRHRLRTPARDRGRRAAPAAVGRQHRRAVGRREAPRRAVPAAAEQARHAAARRADQPPGRRIGRVAGSLPAALPRHRRARSPTIATSSTTRPSGSWNSTAAAAFHGRATTAPGSSRRANAWRRSRRAKKPTPRP